MAHEIAVDDEAAHVGAPADDDAGRRRTFDDVTRERRVGLHSDAVSALVDRLLLAAEQVAHQVALDDAEPPAVVEVGEGDAGRRRVDDVACDERPLESELRVDRHLAETGARIGDDLDVRCGVAAYGAESAVGDAVAGDVDAAGAEDVHAVAVLARAATIGADAHDAVARHDAAVLAGPGAPHLDAVVAAVGDVVVGDLYARGVDAADGRLQHIGDGAIGDATGTTRQRDAVGGAAAECEVPQAHVARVAHVDQPVGGAEHLVAAVEHDALDEDAVGMFRGDEAVPARKLQRCRAGGADEPRAAAQLERADAIASGGKLERLAAADGGVECRLQNCGLIGSAAGNETEVAAGCARACLGRPGARGTGSDADSKAGGKDVAAVDGHCGRDLLFKGRAKQV